jgi:hypothetical protein
MNPNMAKARDRENQVLQAVGLVGWLTTAQVAAWVWPANDAHSARNRAGEVLARLLERGLLMRRESALGTWAYLLTHAGAARATAASDLVFRHGYDLSLLDAHRQALIVTHLLGQDFARKLGPAGVRIAVRSELLDEGSTLLQADALCWDPMAGEWRAAMVVRSLHIELQAKARRIRAAAAHLTLLGHPGTVRQFEQQLGPQRGAGR